MPSELPRIAVRVTKRQYEIITRLAALQGRSRGAVVVDLVEAVEPMLERAAVILARAQAAPDSLKAGLRAVAGAAERQATQAAEVQMGKIDLFVDALPPVMGELGGVRPAAADASPVAGRRRGRADPRASNHGGQVAKGETRKRRKTPKKGVAGGGRR